MAGGLHSAASSLPSAATITTTTTTTTIAAAGAALLLLLVATRSSPFAQDVTASDTHGNGNSSNTNTNTKDVLPSPRTTLLPHLSAAELAELPYPPRHVMPGARDVDTPYGSIRVYEWGPADGAKVLLVHGISTPCVALAALAEELVRRGGRRVMVFDLFGRGYSDAPTNLPYDARLYTTQILLALASSPLSWTGSGHSFAIVGYSLGGGIAADFASYFLPHLVSSLVLIAPGGMLRRARVSWRSWWLYDVLAAPAAPVPWRVVRWLVGRRLWTPMMTTTTTTTAATATTGISTAAAVQAPVDVGNPAQAEAGQVAVVQGGGGGGGGGGNGATGRRDSSLSHPAPLLGADRPHITAAAAVNWQVEHHAGFVAPAFVSSIQCAPVYEQHARWRVLGQKLTAEAERVKGEGEGEGEGKRANPKVLLVLGRDDPIVDVDEVSRDAVEVLGGERNVQTIVLEAGHEVPMSMPREVAERMVEFWEGGGDEV